MIRIIAIALFAALTIGLGACAHKDNASSTTSSSSTMSHHHGKYSK